ncbi:MliC family protein [Terricaulis sp.]|uniref:MliC family protein n=1 Tax=Terricaulis sp. TaxID=2768686 RepID=UPI0037841AFB
MRPLAVLALTAALGALLTACATPCPDVPQGAVTADFNCEDGSSLRVTFTEAPDAARVEQEGYTTLDLPARVTGGGFRYADGGAELHGSRVEMRWQRPGAAETICHRAPLQ